MYDVKKYFPKNVWERTPSGKFYSRPATKADWVRRELWLINFAERNGVRYGE
jgi:hypothetical protein